MWRKGNPFALLVGMQTSAATMENSMKIRQKIKNGSAFWPSSPTSGNISKGTQNTNWRKHTHPYIHCSTIYNHQDMEAAQVSNGKWMDKTTMTHLHKGHKGMLLGSKREENFTDCDSTNGPREHYAKWSKPVRERQMSYDFIHCGIEWTNWTFLGKLLGWLRRPQPWATVDWQLH